MSQSTVLKIVNMLLALDFMLLAVTGIFHERLDYALFINTHPLLGYGLVVLVCTHVFMNRRWIARMFKK